MPTKKTKHPLIREIQLGKTVEEVIEEHFAEYELYEWLRDHLPALILEVISIDKMDLQFQVQTTEDETRIIILNATSDVYLRYCQFGLKDGTVDFEEEVYDACEFLNEIVRRLYGVEKKRPRAMLTREQFVKGKGEACPYCRGKALLGLNDIRPQAVIVGCTQCGATWEKTSDVALNGFKEWRHGR